MYLYSHKPEWSEEFLKERQTILSAYARTIQIHHIGSTAVEGLFSKDCIDMLGVVDNLRQVNGAINCFRNLGFKYKGSYGIKGREYFTKDLRKVHFHIFQEGDENIKKHLGFVQIMKSRPDLVTKLNNLKLSLQSQFPLDKESYQRRKIFFYNEIHKMLEPKGDESNEPE